MRLLSSLAIISAIAPQCALAQTMETWTPSSRTAEAIGTVRFSLTQITLKNGATMQLEAVGTKSYRNDYGTDVTATIYRVIAQTDPARKPGFCDNKRVTFLLVSVPPPIMPYDPPGRTRDVVALKGPNSQNPAPADDCGRMSFQLANARSR